MRSKVSRESRNATYILEVRSMTMNYIRHDAVGPFFAWILSSLAMGNGNMV